jgi:hypothetical protein
MFARITFFFVLGFWLLMNVLLWRSQTVGMQPMLNKIPPQVVWEKILTAPDRSNMEILHYNEHVGFCTWSADVGETPLPNQTTESDEYLPEELTKKVTGYTINLEGRAALDSNRVVHVNFWLKLSTNEVWQEFHVGAQMRPNSWDVSANAATQRIKLQVTDEAGTWQKVLKFSDLQNPEALMQDLGGGDVSIGMLGALIPGGKNGLASAANSVKWEAYADTMQFGHSRVGVYRLETRVLGHKIFIFVSKVGEILWVELPDKIIFRNEAFGHF